MYYYIMIILVGQPKPIFSLYLFRNKSSVICIIHRLQLKSFPLEFQHVLANSKINICTLLGISSSSWTFGLKNHHCRQLLKNVSPVKKCCYPITVGMLNLHTCRINNIPTKRLPMIMRPNSTPIPLRTNKVIRSFYIFSKAQFNHELGHTITIISYLKRWS